MAGGLGVRLGGTAKDVATATDAFVRAAQVLGLTLGEIRQIITFRDRAAPRPAPT